ncbi:MAG: universal stress protein [Planctomycetota bacterium]
MLVSDSRPRNLKWLHAGPLLYGDWGTSRLYVLGLAFLYTAHASVVYLAAIGLLMLAVSWAYTIICRCFPDGGGVYSAAKRLSPTLAVVGSTLLLSGYIMTAAISVVEAFHYFGVPDSLTLPLSAATIGLIGAINWFGAKAAGRFAGFIAIIALGVSAIMAVLCIPFFFKGVGAIEWSYFTEHSKPTEAWVSFTRICLALAGVEAVANMSGLMVEPVGKTAKKTIWPVTIEVVALNMVFGIALTGLNYTVNGTELVDSTQPHAQLIEQMTVEQAALEEIGIVEDEVKEYTNAAMKVIAKQSGKSLLGDAGGAIFGQIAGITFGLLLLSATNTAVMAMVSVLYSMAQDRELPRALKKLNYTGVPWIGLVASVLIPIAVVAVERDVTVLAELYVLGVCGAITVSVGSVAVDRDLEIKTPARVGLAVIAVFLFAVSATIAITVPVSAAFSGGLVALVLGTRFALNSIRGADTGEPLPEPKTGWLAEARAERVVIDPDKPKLMLAARGRNQAEFAVDLARSRGATLFAVFVRPIQVLDRGAPTRKLVIEEDGEAQESLGSVAVLAKANGVPFVPIYAVSSDIPGEILDHTVTYGCDTLIMGKTKRSIFARKLAGDVVSEIDKNRPEGLTIIKRAADAPHDSSKLKMPTGTTPGEDHV